MMNGDPLQLPALAGGMTRRSAMFWDGSVKQTCDGTPAAPRLEFGPVNSVGARITVEPAGTEPAGKAKAAKRTVAGGGSGGGGVEMPAKLGPICAVAGMRSGE